MTLLHDSGLIPVRQRFMQLMMVCTGSALPLELIQAAAPVNFQSGFLRQSQGYDSDAANASLNQLALVEDLAPGNHWVEIQVNLRYFGQRELRFDADPQGSGLVPCLSKELLEQMGVRVESLADPTLLEAACVDLPRLIPDANIKLDGGSLQLSISIPQIAMRRDALGSIDPARWDYGINAAFVSYQASAQQTTRTDTGTGTSADLYLNSGINLGAWRLRSNQSMRNNEEGHREWTRAYAYAQRDLPGTHSNLTLGETYTGGDVFRSVPIKGALIKTDQEMRPDVLQGYAPVIRGVALSRAKLEVLQNGYPIYSTYVSAGPYEIDDLTTAGSGELEVVLTEADGQVRRFTQPYSTIGNLLREGVWNYSTAIGRYNGVNATEQPWIWQSTLAIGTGWNSTLYGGLMASDMYRATALGVSRDMGALGALALDVTRSHADIDSTGASSVQGMSYALKYAKMFTTNTNLRFAGYRYSTEGYRDFDEALRQRDNTTAFSGSRRSRLEVSLHQRVASRSSVSLTMSQQDYWGSAAQQRQYQFNFNTHHAGVSYNLYASQSLSDARNRGNDRQLGLSISLPLNIGHSSNATFDMQNSGERYSLRASLSGSLDDNRLNYRTSLGNDDGRQQSAGLAVGYQAPVASFGAGLTQGNDYRSTSVNASGALLLHAEGVELGPNLGETVALVEVPGTSGVGIRNAIGVETNSRGYALVPYLRPYRYNHIELQTDQLGPEIEIDNGSAQVVPARGAVIKTTFAARVVTRMVITAHTESGKPLPFGAQASDAQGNLLGIAGQGGVLVLSTGMQAQTLDVSWGEQNRSQCRLHIDPAAMTLAEGYRMQALTCSQ
ncbi:fimbrial biogenesis outer membrane usher protein [Pseudomonas syringae pv. actinidiae]|uniref:fimbria/pilus outer membrane usher protein n=1 Tax=Pseudomonas syringae TaxID=317 RepID=UPI00046B6892|nr:fimbria/pilus outer membrane usher protein [Pseudomonas syringae]AYL81602.1 fimbrial biogenesis outer membrane usher protein [Pseudomonas syringae pv. actinidiae str. Shaanxi_M228]MBL3605089.1 fimbrial biogenesis outer membrane usher protein [Pseudomonas syringae pv. actinidiae]MBL3634415.1 fimbrial biogenesis outer membrane usher protein [Pseudomonas syringae pv. actinidiae]MBL3663959.1 fimbrial biogenesis outer membrane usher protein [Pseudomonas syringae pv. actinidiae]MDU8587564.1 fimbr